MLRPGDLVAQKYRIERELGAGGMGSVYVAVNEVLEKRVALKVMSVAFASSPDAVQRFFREAMSASRVRHPAIVEIYDAGAHDGAPWMAMELLSGESLGERMARAGALSLGELVPIFGPVLDALDAVHQHGIVHRDLKPDNIFLERLPDGRMEPKLLDFGIAKTQDGLSKLTAAGAVMGTAHYLAPEQARDSSTVDPRTDLYAIGVVLYEALSGRMPHEASTLPELIAKLIMEDPAPLATLAPHVPASLARVVHWCLARDPSARPQRAAELSARLTEALAHVQPVSSWPAAPAPPMASTPGSEALVRATARTALAGTAPLAPHGALVPTAPMGTLPMPAAPPAGSPFGSPFGAATPALPRLGAASSSAPRPPTRPRRSTNAIVITVLVLLGLGAACVVVVPVGMMAVAGVLARSAVGDGALGMSFPRRWESWRAPWIVDVDGDGASDVVGWSQQIIDTDNHELLCAYHGRSGAELWCMDLGEQNDTTSSKTVLVGDRIVHVDGRGRLRGVRLRDGTDLGFRESVGGRPQTVCVVGTEQLFVRTRDSAWSGVRVADGAVSNPTYEAPEGCIPARTTESPTGSDTRVTSSSGWTRGPHSHGGASPSMAVRRIIVSPRGEQLLVGVGRGHPRMPGRLAFAPAAGVDPVWEIEVPIEPQLAQHGIPEALAVGDELVYVSYEMIGHGEFPRRLAALRLADGQRVWDVGLPRPYGRGRTAWYVIAERDLLVLGVSTVLLGIDPANGALRFHIGEPTPNR